MALKSSFVRRESEIMDNLLRTGNDRRRGEEQLFTAYSYFIQEGMNKYSFTQDEAFDAYSDTILAAIERIDNRSFEGRSSLKTYIYQIFHNKCVDLVRKKTTNKNSVHQTSSITEMLNQVSDAARSVIQAMMEKSDKEALRARLNELGDNCRQLLLLWADGYADKEIAQSIKYKSPDVVKTSRLRCMEKLRRMFTSRQQTNG